MRILFINPIMYTSETQNVSRVKTVKDSMAYDLCLAFTEAGHEVTLFAAEPYKPCYEESYPFEIIWGKCAMPKLFQVHRMPVMPEVFRYIKENRDKIDLIISGEVFSVSSLFSCWTAKSKLIIWHELAKHNALLKKIPSRLWYNIVARLFMREARVVARSESAKEFIKRYCTNVSTTVIDHGVNLEKFQTSSEKTNSFIVVSQLIPRKRIDGIIEKFAEYLESCDKDALLYIVGEGEQKELLQEQVRKLKIENNVQFRGKMRHDELQSLLAKAQALLVNTIKDNSMISIVESIAVGTPVITTAVPLNSPYIRKNKLGIVKEEWNATDLYDIVSNNQEYVDNCLAYREQLSTDYRVKQFVAESKWNQPA